MRNALTLSHTLALALPPHLLCIVYSFCSGRREFYETHSRVAPRFNLELFVTSRRVSFTNAERTNMASPRSPIMHGWEWV